MSSFLIKGGIVLPKPTRVARTKIRNLYEDGYPGAAPRPDRAAGGAFVSVTNAAHPWWSPGGGYRVTGKTTTILPGLGTVREAMADHERDMTLIGQVHPRGPVTGLLGELCPDPSETDPSGWSPEDCK